MSQRAARTVSVCQRHWTLDQLLVRDVQSRGPQDSKLILILTTRITNIYEKSKELHHFNGNYKEIVRINK